MGAASQFRGSRRKATLTLDDRPCADRFSAALYEVEALSPNGRRLFLVHWHRTRTTTSSSYDSRRGQLQPDPARRAGREDERQSRSARSRPATGTGCSRCTCKPDGAQLRPRARPAHRPRALHRPAAASATSSPSARRPSRSRPTSASSTSTSPFSGSVTTVDLSTLERLVLVRFRALPLGRTSTRIGPSAAVTPNGRMLAFVAARPALALDTAFGRVRGPARIRRGFTALGFRAGRAPRRRAPRHGAPAFASTRRPGAL